MIEVCGLTKQYGNKTVVNDVTFAIDKGEVVGILGPNGAGKSTTMNMITGYISSTCGTVKVNGHDILEDASRAKAGIGYLPEIPPLYTDMTVRDYLSFVYDLKGCARKENIRNKKEHIAEVCEVVRIDGVYGRLIKNLSKGYKQRVGIAQALIGNPDILIFDEPTVGLDPREIVEIRNLIKRLGKDRTIILSSHILSEVQAVCERVIVINEGFVVLDASVEDLSAAMGANSRYALRLAAPDDADVVGVLSALDGIAEVRDNGSTEKGTRDFVVAANPNADIRRIIFDECAKRNWYILMMTPIGMSLEDIFLSLVDKPSSQASPKAIDTAAERSGNEKTDAGTQNDDIQKDGDSRDGRGNGGGDTK